MEQIFPLANALAGVLVLVVGFGFHWIGQTISVFNWPLATRLHLQEEGMPPEFRIYEHSIAVADVVIGWTYGIAGLGLLVNAAWAYKLAWLPGSILFYHGISYWLWTRNQRRAGRRLMSNATRVAWSLANVTTGLLTMLVAWHGL